MISFVYVGSAESNEIYVLQLDGQSGGLTLVEQVPIPCVMEPGPSTPMAVSPDRRFLYVGTRGEPKIAAGFAINPASGKLEHIASGPLADSMAYLATDRTGRFLLGASYFGHKITVNPINPPGAVQPVQQVLPNYPNAHSILADAGNRHVLAVTLGNDCVKERTSSTLAGFKVNPAGGTLSPIASVPTEKGPRAFNIDPSGRYLLAVGQLSHGMSSYKINADSGKLTWLKGYPMGKNPNWVEIVDVP